MLQAIKNRNEKLATLKYLWVFYAFMDKIFGRLLKRENDGIHGNNGVGKSPGK